MLTQESFDQLLAWLAADREQAGRLYEEIRLRLVKIFTCRGCPEADDLADKTIDRVCTKLPEVAPTYVGNPALYFYAVGRMIFHEHLRKKVDPPLPLPSPQLENNEEEERAHLCLERCLQELPTESRDLVVSYYEEEKRAKIDRRKGLADRLGIEPNALRGRAHRIRRRLEECVTKCLGQEVERLK